MTEAVWLAAADQERMLWFLKGKGKASERKFRLFAVACCLNARHLLKKKCGEQAIELAEQFADGAAELSDLLIAYSDINYWIRNINDFHRNIHQNDQAWAWVAVLRAVSTGGCFYGRHWEREDYNTVECAVDAMEYVARATAWNAKSDLIHCSFGNPFRPLTVDPSWLTSTVLAFASQMYESRDFSPMPILADALQDAGCDNDDVLNHCRQPGEHVKGCWVVDLLLGKK
jgi:hypothetical protein